MRYEAALPKKVKVEPMRAQQVEGLNGTESVKEDKESTTVDPKLEEKPDMNLLQPDKKVLESCPAPPVPEEAPDVTVPDQAVPMLQNESADVPATSKDHHESSAFVPMLQNETADVPVPATSTEDHESNSVVPMLLDDSREESLIEGNALV